MTLTRKAKGGRRKYLQASQSREGRRQRTEAVVRHVKGPESGQAGEAAGEGDEAVHLGGEDAQSVEGGDGLGEAGEAVGVEVELFQARHEAKPRRGGVEPVALGVQPAEGGQAGEVLRQR